MNEQVLFISLALRSQVQASYTDKFKACNKTKQNV